MDLVGRTLSHYLIESRLGAGGMGVVYRARDLALGRLAAIKVLPPEFPPALRQRLRQEAEGCARLQHPAIATFYESGESGGVLFLAMEHVDGETLRRRLDRGPLPWIEALTLAGSLLEALGHAHAAGILHRDIKPDNIMLARDGRAKLLDFGLARALASPGGEAGTQETRLTADGMVVGTVGYMSPEQVRGEPLSPASDLYAVGLVLHEALTGRPVFEGTPLARLAAALHVDVPPLARADAPPGLNDVLARALAREPSGRYSSAAAFLCDLRGVDSAEAVPAVIEKMVVFDLQGLRPDAEDAWIGSAVADIVTADLSRAPRLQIVGREKAARAAEELRAAGRSSDPLAVATALGCRWVVSGSYQKMGESLRLTARVMEVPTGRVAAAPRLDGTLDGLFELQDRLSAALLSGIDRDAAPAAGAAAPAHLKAYEWHARGRQELLRHGKSAFEQARASFEAAVRADPSYAAPLAGLAAVHALRFTWTTDPDSLQVAAGYARRAIELDPAAGEPHVWLGYVLMRQRRFREAVEAERRAIELSPHDVMGLYFAGVALGFGGDLAEAIACFQKALEVEPNHGWSLLGLGWCHLDSGHADEALWCLRRAVALEQSRQGAAGPTSGVAGYLGEALRRCGRLDEARAACLEGLDVVERADHMYRDTFRGVALCALGRTALQQNDRAAAEAAFRQAITQLRGRVHALGGGHLLVQALAGMARAGADGRWWDEARDLYASREGHDFTDLWVCTEGATLLELARAAAASAHPDEAARLEAEARRAGAAEAGSGEGGAGDGGSGGDESAGPG